MPLQLTLKHTAETSVRCRTGLQKVDNKEGSLDLTKSKERNFYGLKELELESKKI